MKYIKLFEDVTKDVSEEEVLRLAFISFIDFNWHPKLADERGRITSFFNKIKPDFLSSRINKAKGIFKLNDDSKIVADYINNNGLKDSFFDLYRESIVFMSGFPDILDLYDIVIDLLDRYPEETSLDISINDDEMEFEIELDVNEDSDMEDDGSKFYAVMGDDYFNNIEKKISKLDGNRVDRSDNYNDGFFTSLTIKYTIYQKK